MATWRDAIAEEQLQLTHPLPPLRPTRLQDHSCYHQSPQHEFVIARVRCNRPRGHEGLHQKIRAYDFKVLAEWSEYEYTIFPPKL